MAGTHAADATEQGRADSRRRLDELIDPPRPLLRPAPRSAMFFPLAVVAAVLPGLYALNWWDLSPPGPWWGLRGLAVLEGQRFDQVPMEVVLGTPGEVAAYRQVAFQPPLYAWLEALGLWLSQNREPMATVLPSYAAGAVVVILVYLHGRLWAGMGLGLTAALLTGFNRDLLVQMQQATSTTLGLAGLMAAMLCYGQFLRAGARASWGWAVLGGLALGLALMANGPFGLVCIPIVLVHQAIVKADPGANPIRRAGRWWRSLRFGPSLRAGLLTLGLALLVAAPWYAMMASRYGGDFLGALLAPPYAGRGVPRSGLLFTLLSLTPATLPLGVYAVFRVGRQALAVEGDDPATVGGVFWLAWLAVAALLPAVWPSGPRAAMTLLLLAPLNLLAAQAMIDLATRRIPARRLVWLAPATALTVAWSLSTDLREAVLLLADWRQLDAATWLGLHLAVDLLIVIALATRRLDRWARRRDRRRRLVLGGFLLAVLTVNAAFGLREVRFRHIETAELLDLRDVLLRRQRDHDRPFTGLFVVEPKVVEAAEGDPALATTAPGGRLRFILYATLPDLAMYPLRGPEELLDLPRAQDAQWLVILIGSEQRLPYTMQSRLGLESIYPTGAEPFGSTRTRRANPGGLFSSPSAQASPRPTILVAFATKGPPPSPRRR